MLKSLRKNTKVIIWVVILCFALWGGFSIGTQFQKRGRVAGEVFGKDVSFQEYNLFYRSTQMFNLGTVTDKTEKSLRQQTWQGIIYSREAKRQKVEVPDTEVRQEILRLMEGHQITNPSPTVYKNWLAMNLGETPQEFESQVREILRIQKLVNKFNAQPIPSTPFDEKEALLRYKNENDLLSAEMLLFPTLDEAKNFRQKIKNKKDWKKEAGKMPDRLKAPPMISLGAWSRDFKVPEPSVFHLHRSAKETVSEPVRVGNEYAVFFILDSATAPEDKFQSTLKGQYLKEFEEQKKYQRFVQWHLEVQKKANLKDHLPVLEEEQNPAVTNPSPSSSSPPPSPASGSAPSSESSPQANPA